MPTGYTADLMNNGQTFEEFAMGCARAFGACITMRDEPRSTPVPDKFDPSDWHGKLLERTKEKVRKLEALSKSERIEYGQEAKEKDIGEARESLKKRNAENQRLNDMMADVSRWLPPTPEHKEFKEFMLEQLKTSLNSTTYSTENLAKAEAKSPLEYYNEALSVAKRSIEYHAQHNLKEIELAWGRTEWVRHLRESLHAEG